VFSSIHKTIAMYCLLFVMLATASFFFFDSMIAERAKTFSRDDIHWLRYVSDLADTPAVLWVLLLLLILREFKACAIGAFSVLMGGGIASVAKEAVGRVRPDGASESFPSGHATAAFAMATVLCWRYPKLRLALYGAATLVALSRIGLSKHFISDVMVGAAVGMACSACAIGLLDGLSESRFQCLRLASLPLLVPIACNSLPWDSSARASIIFAPVVLAACTHRYFADRKSMVLHGDDSRLETIIMEAD